LADALAAIGAGVLKALVAVRAGIIIAAFAFIQIAILTAAASKVSEEPIKTLFIWVTFAFGGGGVLAMLLFFIEQFRRLLFPSAGNR
jgi:hypothetical protein